LIKEKTGRLILIAGNRHSIAAELHDRRALAEMLGAEVPADWPPEALKDALTVFRELYEEHSDWEGWLHWYAVLIDVESSVLCGSVVFRGPPGETGMVEIGYSVLPAYQGKGLATEMVDGLIRHLTGLYVVPVIEAETDHGNAASQRVLEKNKFIRVGAGTEANTVRYRYQYTPG
jgi:[ribosomal protein S5]-alanine N-acetyltransferase